VTLAPTDHRVFDDEFAQTELLIKAARQKALRRRLRWFAAVVILCGAAAAIFLLAHGLSPSRSVSSARGTGTSTVAETGSIVSPEHPYQMTVSSDGTLFVVDVKRDQILRRLTSGKFESVVGDGRRGFSGDGGQAVDARINVTPDSGLVVRDGILYFSDTGNNRIREVLRDGVVKSIAGGGTRPLGVRTEPALSVALEDPNGLTFGPNGELYVAGHAIYRLGENGTLQWVAGEKGTVPKNWKGVWSSPGVQWDFLEPIQIAFDDQGNLFDAGGGGGWGLYEHQPTGFLKYLGHYRGDGNAPSLAESSNGSVLMSSRFGLFWIGPSGALLPTSTSSVSLNRALGHARIRPHRNIFIGGDGLAISSGGTIYVDTNTGNTFTSVSAILMISPKGQVKALWRS
jgi:sugar lactone lactonase YvrE